MTEKAIKVMKFGGTSVATPESRQRVVEHITRASSDGWAPLVVVSAMGRRGSPYATDTLLDMIHEVGEPVDPRDEDLVFHVGEIISVSIMSHLLKISGLDARGLTGGQARIYSDGHYRRGSITRIDTSVMMSSIDQGIIPVIAGGQGVTEDDGEINILGRGASDTSAVAIASAVGADTAEIFSDVPGIAITDPRVIPEADLLAEVSYRRMYEMALFGARVIHPGAVLLGQSGVIPIAVKSTFSFDPGTVITNTENEPDLVGIPALGPVNLILIPKGSLACVCDPKELYNRFAAVCIDDEESDRTIIGVDAKWYDGLQAMLDTSSVVSEEVLCDQSLVSVIGKKDYISSIASRVKVLLSSSGIPVTYHEMTSLRHTFAVPHDKEAELIHLLYGEFAR